MCVSVRRSDTARDRLPDHKERAKALWILIKLWIKNTFFLLMCEVQVPCNVARRSVDLLVEHLLRDVG